MAFKKNFVAAVKCHGKILKEFEDQIILPFGSEFSLLFNNLFNRRAVVNVDIDGGRAFTGLVVGANSIAELERFENKPNRFKFIEKTEKISEFRGDRLADGVVRIEFWFERERYEREKNWYIGKTDKWPSDWNVQYGNGIHFRSVSLQSTDGITVPGSKSDQTFSTTSFQREEPSYVITFKLIGVDMTGKEVLQPVTKKTMIQCATCGDKSLYGTKFCSTCGTYLG